MSLAKFKTNQELAAIREQLSQSGRRMVFTNGCFDILHVGHVRYLQQAKELGDVLVVALNSDASVRELKGENRPINNESERAEVLGALACVDYVTVFPDKRVTALVSDIKPHIYAKGGDYTIETLDQDEVTALRNANSEIKILPLVPGKSTTNILKSCKS